VAGLSEKTLGEVSFTLTAGYLLKCAAVTCLPTVNTLKWTSAM